MKQKITIEILREKIEQYDLLEKSIVEIGNDEELSNYGLDSIGFVNLIASLEEDFDLMVDDEKLLFENFNTINNIYKSIVELCEA